MQNPAHPTPETIPCNGITWTKFDMRLAGANEPDWELCADGEGIYVIKEESEGYFLYKEGFMVKALGSKLQVAVEQATAYLQATNPALFEELKSGHGGLAK